MNEKLKIYLDTSVISYLLQEDVPDRRLGDIEYTLVEVSAHAQDIAE